MSLLMDLGWMPIAPIMELDNLNKYNDASFRQRDWSSDVELQKQYTFNFPRLSVMTSDLHFYKVVRVLNTPLQSIKVQDGKFCHLWFFNDINVQKTVVCEFSDSGTFSLAYIGHAPDEQLKQTYTKISALVNQPEVESLRYASTYTGPKEFF